MIEITGLQKSFGSNKVLEDINLQIAAGDIYGLIGVSGAGKSTLLRCINGLESYDSGSLIIDGVEVGQLNKHDMRQFRSSIGMIFQQFHLMERMTVYQNVALPLKCWNRSKVEIEKRVSELLSLVELEDKRDAKPRELSGGQKQRVAIARALAMNPKILLCDEATSALDPNITGSILELLKRINKELGITIIVVTHQMEVVKQICNRVSILSHGVLTCTGEVKDVFLKQTDALEELFSESNIVKVPEEGISLEILFCADKDSTLLSEMAMETGVAFRVIWSKLDKYSAGAYGSYTINIPNDDFSPIEAFLRKAGVEWRILTNE